MAILHLLGPSLLCYIFFLITFPMAYSLSESELLIKLMKSFTNAKGIDSWGSGKGPCVVNQTWVGVTCENGLVSVLRLEGLGLSGKIDVDVLLELKAVRVISFQNNSFSGPIPDLNRLGALKAIFLSGNQFSGEIPSDYFENMQSLKKLWLGGNHFTGEIPASLAKLPNLTELHLENNQFSGQIPAMGQLTLDSIDLSNNRLEGEIPARLQQFNESSFKGNSGLCGANIGKSCPETAPDLAAMSDIGSNKEKNPSSHKIATGLMTAAVVILSVMIIAIFVMSRRQEKFNLLDKENPEDAMEVRVSSASKKDMDSHRKGMGSNRRGSQHGKGGGGDLVLVNEETGVFGLTDLMKAGAEVLGNGAMGSSYKAMMANGMTVVVKRIKDMNKLGKEGFGEEIKRFGRIRHRNVLTPLAYHFRKDEKLSRSVATCDGSGFVAAASMAVEAGTLEKGEGGRGLGAMIARSVVDGFGLVKCISPQIQIGGGRNKNYMYQSGEHTAAAGRRRRRGERRRGRGRVGSEGGGDRGPSHAELNWPTRLKIVQGIARGLDHLHTELSSFNLPHGNLKSSNVLLSSDFEPLLVDYGFNQLANQPQAIQTLLAYKSPEVSQTHQVSPKSDVYCLGIIILEILTGKFPSQYLTTGKGGTDVVQWVKSAISEGRESELFDPEITNSRKSIGEMERLLRIAAACTESNPDHRPEMGEVVRKIEEIQIEGGGGDGGGGVQEGRGIQVLPPLWNGYVETTAASPQPQSHVSNVLDGYAGRRLNSLGERSGRRNSDSFAFDIS
ncbi:Pollen receptor-like kinase 3 [Sarracenia purpurea var. burkii]